MKIFTYIVLATLLSCSSIRFDKRYIEHWSSEGQKKEPFEAPYISTFSRGNKELIYIAADHENSIQSKTFKTILKVITEEDPKFIVLEGFENRGEISPKWYVEYSVKCRKSEFRHCGEPAYSAFLANKNHTPFAGGEPTDIEILNQLKKKGYAEIDIIGFYLLRQIPQLRRQGRLDTKNPERQLTKYLNHFSKETGGDGSIHLNQFKDWYKKHSSSKKDYFDINSMDVAPIDGNKGTYFQNISADIGMIREGFLNQVINENLNLYSKVLVIYGGGHLVKSRKVYEKAFGPSKNSKPY